MLQNFTVFKFISRFLGKILPLPQIFKVQKSPRIINLNFSRKRRQTSVHALAIQLSRLLGLGKIRMYFGLRSLRSKYAAGPDRVPTEGDVDSLRTAIEKGVVGAAGSTRRDLLRRRHQSDEQLLHPRFPRDQPDSSGVHAGYLRSNSF